MVILQALANAPLGLSRQEFFDFVYITDDLPVTADRKMTVTVSSTGTKRLRALPKPTIDLSWLLSDNPAASPQNLRALYKAIQHFMRETDFGMVDALFKAVDVRNLPAEMLVAMLRYSFAAHKKLQNWSSFLAQVRQELDRRGMDNAQVLAGL
jgi:hypothetical protein